MDFNRFAGEILQKWQNRYMQLKSDNFLKYFSCLPKEATLCWLCDIVCVKMNKYILVTLKLPYKVQLILVSSVSLLLRYSRTASTLSR
jgi:hypothetical protein